MEETLRSDFEDSRDMFETKSRLQEEVASKSSELNKSFTLREKLKETVVGQVQTLVDSALQFTGRDRVNTVTGLLEGGGEHWVDDNLVASEVALSEREEEMSSNNSHNQEDFNPEMAWNSSYTNRKKNASFSMFKPIA